MLTVRYVVYPKAGKDFSDVKYFFFRILEDNLSVKKNTFCDALSKDTTLCVIMKNAIVVKDVKD